MSNTPEETWRAEQDMDSALKRIRETKPGKMTGGIEALYGQAYQHLVRLNVKPQVRRKYRINK